MEEATLLAWKVSEGAAVAEGQAIAEVSTDKVDMDLEAPFGGVVQTLVAQPGEAVPVGGVIAVILSESGDLLGGLDLTPDPGAAPVVAAPPPPRTALGTAIVPASPPARKLARDLGIDLAAITPTGTRGQVTPNDIRRHAQRPAPEMDRHEAVRRATAEIVTRAAAIPQFTLYRTLLVDRAAAGKGGRSWTTELVRALAASLRLHPELNRRWDDTEQAIVPVETVGVGVAVDRPGMGLVVAAIRDPDLTDPDEADRAVKMLADRARSGKLRPEDMVPASVTLSNLGGLGVDRFNALLVPPQPLILSAGSIRMRPVATADGALKAALTCEVGLTVDHRVADGADGARFLESLATALGA
jgi:pyruvate dehydrogenase E2 component (dihydrolipoamide acetyltransferase)